MIWVSVSLGAPEIQVIGIKYNQGGLLSLAQVIDR